MRTGEGGEGEGMREIEKNNERGRMGVEIRENVYLLAKVKQTMALFNVNYSHFVLDRCIMRYGQWSQINCEKASRLFIQIIFIRVRKIK